MAITMVLKIKNKAISSEIIQDNDGTLINISPDLDLLEHKQFIELIKEFIHLFTDDISSVRSANIDPCQI